MRILLALSTFLYLVSGHCDQSETDVLARETAEDSKLHGCRACKKIAVEISDNCPKKGYDCDEALEMRSNILVRGGCECSQLRCKDNNATLAIGGEPVKKLICADKQWTSSTNITSESGVCARKCDRGVCRTYPEEFFLNKPNLLSFDVLPPDADHACAWGTCSYGALASNSDGDHTFNSVVEFSCAGDGRWKEPDGTRYDIVACTQKKCESLVPEQSSIFCGPTHNSKHVCYDPEFVVDNSEISKMSCDDANALRYSSNNELINPVCSHGQWTNDGVDIGEDTKVMCVTCPILRPQPFTTEPIYVGNNKEATCPPNMDLFINIYYSGTAKKVKVDTVQCTNQSTWEAIGGDFGEYISLSEVIQRDLIQMDFAYVAICQNNDA